MASMISAAPANIYIEDNVAVGVPLILSVAVRGICHKSSPNSEESLAARCNRLSVCIVPDFLEKDV